MRPSIRTFLLINLLLSVTLITSLAIIGNLFLAHRDIQSQLDAQLIRSAFRMKSFFSDYHNGRSLKTIQKNLDTEVNPKVSLATTPKTSKFTSEQAKNIIEFQIWDRSNRLVLRSHHAPSIPFSNGTQGLSSLYLDGHNWRINTLHDANTGLTFMVAEQSNYRQRLENQLTQDSIFIMLITYPFLGILIWIIVGRGLRSLRKIAREVRNRAPNNLSPVDIKSVPTEIEPLITELNSLFDRLYEAFEREKRFTADAAHELKTPLAALNTQTQVALRADTTEDRNHALMKVLAGVNRSTHVVQQLLTLSRMLPEATINEPKMVNLFSQATDVAALLAPEAIAKNIDLSLDADKNDNFSIMGNATAINILIRNLVDNAIRYTNNNGKVVITLTAKPDDVLLEVIDNGPGIPDALKKRVFERFFRIIGNQTTGSGLGLGIVLQISKLHNAKIELLEPEDERGLNVSVTFPRDFNR